MNGQTVHYRDREDEVLFIDLRSKGEPFEKKFVQLSEAVIREAAEVYHNWQEEGYTDTYSDIPEYCQSVDISQIEKKQFTLIPSKYIKFNEEKGQDIEERVNSLRKELLSIIAEGDQSQAQVINLLSSISQD